MNEYDPETPEDLEAPDYLATPDYSDEPDAGSATASDAVERDTTGSETIAHTESPADETESIIDRFEDEAEDAAVQKGPVSEADQTEASPEPAADTAEVSLAEFEDELPPPPNFDEPNVEEPTVEEPTENEPFKESSAHFDTVDEAVPPPPLPPTEGSKATATPHLERRLDRRIVGGVSAGLADYWGVSVTWIRLGFAVLAAFAFLGVFVYAAAWVLIPPNDGTEAVADSLARRLRSGESWMGAGLIALAALIVIGSLDFVSGQLAFAVALFVLGFMLYRGVPDRSPPSPGGTPQRPAANSLSAETNAPEVGSRTPPPSASLPPPAAGPPRRPRVPKPPSILNRVAVAALFISVGVLALVDFNGARVEARHYFATGLAVIAAALVVGAWRGRARLMILPGLVLLLPAFLLSFTTLSFDDTQIVDLNLRPGTAAEIEAVYRYDAGDVTLDLTAVDELPNRLVQVDLDAGRIRVILPNDASARVVSRVGAGSISDIGYGDGLNVERRVVYRGEGDQIQLELSLDFGEINVIRSEGN